MPCPMLILEIFQVDALDKIEGIAFRKGKGIVVNPQREYIKNLDTLPFADLEQIHPKQRKKRSYRGEKLLQE